MGKTQTKTQRVDLHLLNKLIPWNRVILDKLTVPKLVKKFSAFDETRSFITAFIRNLHMSLSCARSIHSTRPSYSLKIRFNNVIPFTPRSSKCYLVDILSQMNPLYTL
jgi:hypothetical protein